MGAIGADGATEVAGGGLLFRHRGRLALAVVAKGRAELAQRAPMRWLGSAAILGGPRYDGGEARRAGREPADLVPPRARVDVTVVGHGYPPSGDAAAGHVRLSLYRGIRAVIDKRLELRSAGPFAPIPIVDDRVGEAPGGGPAVFDARAPERGASFGPIDRLGSRVLQGGVLELGDEVVGEALQWAPRDQQVDGLGGDEWLVLEGMHAGGGTFRTQLVTMHVGAEVEIRGAGRRQVAMGLCALHVDADEGIATIGYVGWVEVAPATTAADIRISLLARAAGLPDADDGDATMRLGAAAAGTAAGGTADLRSLGTAPLTVQAPFPIARGAAPRPVEAPAARATPFEGSAAWPDAGGGLTVGLASPTPSAAVAPFELAAPGVPLRAAPEVPGAPWAATAAHASVPPGGEVTMTLSRARPEPQPPPRRAQPEPPPPPVAPPTLVRADTTGGGHAHASAATEMMHLGRNDSGPAPVEAQPGAAHARVRPESREAPQEPAQGDIMAGLRGAGVGDGALEALHRVLHPSPPPPDDEPPENA